jgi:carbon monoxide dehydrogenase subunit G
MQSRKIFSAVILFFVASLAQAADFVEVSKSITVNASVEEVWKKVGDFCAIQEWHPAIKECKAYDDHGTFYRTLTLEDGATISEKHAGEEANSYTYFIKKSPLPVKAYKANFSAKDDAGKTVITWDARFKSKGASDEEAKATIEGIYDAGLSSIADSFK